MDANTGVTSLFRDFDSASRKCAAPNGLSAFPSSPTARIPFLIGTASEIGFWNQFKKEKRIKKHASVDGDGFGRFRPHAGCSGSGRGVAGTAFRRYRPTGGRARVRIKPL